MEKRTKEKRREQVKKKRANKEKESKKQFYWVQEPNFTGKRSSMKA